MIFLSASTFLSGDVMSPNITPTKLDDITTIRLENAEYSDLYASSDTTLEMTTIPEGWGWDTILHADYSTGGCNAGNVNWSLSTVSDLIVKRKLNTDYKWITLQTKHIETMEDLTSRITFIDKTPTNGTWTYAIVPVLNTEEGSYSTTDVEVSITKLVVLDMDETHSTSFIDGDISLECLENPGVYATMYNKYPTVVYNSDANYKNVTLNAAWLSEDNCLVDEMIESDLLRTQYLNTILNFLTNRKTKLIKYIDGQRFLVQITTLPSVSAGDTYQVLYVSFTGTEVGDCETESTLYAAGLISATQEWWQS